MAMREKLIEILRVPIFPHELVDPTEAVADYLLDNDVVPVVRCKDCKHLGIKDFAFGCCNRKMIGIIQPDDYCSYGERRAE